MFATRIFVYAMATTKTKTIAVRLPTAIISAIAADAEFVSQTPGAFLREMLVKRYSSPRVVRNADDVARRLDQDLVEVSE